MKSTTMFFIYGKIIIYRSEKNIYIEATVYLKNANFEQLREI